MGPIMWLLASDGVAVLTYWFNQDDPYSPRLSLESLPTGVAISRGGRRVDAVRLALA